MTLSGMRHQDLVKGLEGFSRRGVEGDREPEMLPELLVYGRKVFHFTPKNLRTFIRGLEHASNADEIILS